MYKHVLLEGFGLNAIMGVPLHERPYNRIYIEECLKVDRGMYIPVKEVINKKATQARSSSSRPKALTTVNTTVAGQAFLLLVDHRNVPAPTARVN